MKQVIQRAACLATAIFLLQSSLTGIGAGKYGRSGEFSNTDDHAGRSMAATLRPEPETNGRDSRLSMTVSPVSGAHENMAKRIEITGVKNTYEVTPWLYRGGQPSAVGIEELKKLGIKTVVSFRWGQKVTAAESAAIKSAGMRYEGIPLNYWVLPDQAVIDHFISLLDNEENRPIYVHCMHGCDRTGVLCAIFRIARMNWSVQDAYNEMVACGFRRFRLHHLKWVLFNYARRAPGAHPGNKPTSVSVNQS